MGHLAYQTDGNGTILASFTYDSHGVPTSVTVGSDPTSAPRYYYVYNGHGDVIALVDANGNAVATYAYDAWGVVTINTESFANGWHNPYLYDGRDGVRYDPETGLYWMSVRAYDPTLGRFISQDPLGRVPLMGWTTQPYAYAGNNPLLNVDPSGQRFAEAVGARAQAAAMKYQRKVAARVYPAHPSKPKLRTVAQQQQSAQHDALMDSVWLGLIGAALFGASVLLGAITVTQPWLVFVLGAVEVALINLVGEVGILAGMFTVEQAKPLSWFTYSNLETFRAIVTLFIAGWTLATILIGGLPKAVLSTFVGLLSGGAIGAGIFLRLVNHYIDDQEAALRS